MSAAVPLVPGRDEPSGGAEARTRSPAADSCNCSHCGLVVPRGLVVAERPLQFCCHGCETAWSLIHDSGLEAWYRLAQDRRQVADEDRAAIAVDSFDSPGFVSRFSRPLSGDLREITLAIDGIHCAACIWLIERLGRICPGVVRSSVQFSRRTVTIAWHADQVPLSRIARALRQLGYTASPVTPGVARDADTRENRRHLMRLGIAGAAAGNNMLIATALYLGLFQGMDAGHLWLLRVASCVVGLVSLLWPGRVFFQGALAALRTRTPHVDLPLALGLGAGGIGGVINTLTGRGEIFFDSLSMLVFLLLVGRYIQFRQQRRAADAIDLLYRMTPPFAWKIGADGVAAQVPAELLSPGDRIQVRSGETVPADGCLVAGETLLDESILTGESQPVQRVCGETVSAGTLNLRSPVELSVTAAGDQTRLGGILKMVQAAAADRPAVVQWADRMGGWFVVAVTLLALVTLAAWLWVGSPLAIDHMVALLVVACPCALAMSTPLTVSVALGRAATRGIMIKGGDVLARLAQPGRIWLDKTGTLTMGQMRVVDWEGDESLKAEVAAIQVHSSHPVAAAFAAASFPGLGGENGATQSLPTASDVRQVTGQGIEGFVAGRKFRIGRESFAGPAQDASASAASLQSGRWQAAVRRILASGWSPVFISVDGQVRAVAAVGDPVRPEATGLIRELQDQGWQVGILSGDHPDIVARVATQIGIPAGQAHGGLSPEDKVARVRQPGTAAPVVMVGDGVNDSPSLAAADVGIAVHSGAHASLQAAPVWLARSGIGEILTLLNASRKVMRTIRVAVFVSLAYNLLAIALAAFGLIHPLLAAALMPVSSLSVVTLAVTGRSFQALEPVKN